MNYNILNKADEVIQAKINGDEIKGASLCVIHKGDTVYFRQFGMADVATEYSDDKGFDFSLLFYDKACYGSSGDVGSRERADLAE